MRPFRRVGDDLLVTWDAEDPTTDVFLQAAHSVARALIVKRAAAAAAVVDVGALERSIDAVEKQLDKIGEITTWTNTIKANAGKIEGSLVGITQVLAARVAELRGHADAVRRMVEIDA
jgi:hypothetical protein